MRDVLGWRCKFGVLGPSTNTIVQPDFEMMRPPGVTNHYSRIFTPNAQAVSNDTFMAGTQLIGDNTLDAVRSVMTCSPDYLVMGMSAVTFYGGAAGADAFRAKVAHASGVGVSIGSHSCTAALKAYGGVKRIAFLSPYYPVANAEVTRYFTESGFEVVRDLCLECKTWTAIAEVPTGRAAREADLAQRRRPRRRCHRAGRHQPEHGPARRRRRALARQTGHCHQHRDLLARAAPEQDHGQDRRAGAIAGRVLIFIRSLRRRAAAPRSEYSVRALWPFSG